MPLGDYVDPATVEPAALNMPELTALGEAADRALSALAQDTPEGSDATQTALLLFVENVFLRRRGVLDYSAMIAPVVDQVVPHVPSVEQPRPPTNEHFARVRTLVEAGLAYRKITDALMNAAQGRMEAHRAVADRRVLFVPSRDIRAELRNRWFELRWRGGRDAAGHDLVPRNMEQVVPRIDEAADAQGLALRAGSYRLPEGNWYETYCASIVDPTLEAQFEHVGETEAWAGLAVRDLKRALRPLWMRAARRLLGHLRAAKWLREIAHEPDTTLVTAIERVSAATLHAEFVGAGLDAARAERLVETMTRRRPGERYPIASYPLLPMPAGDLAFLPSCILYGNWPMARERAAAREARDAAIGNVRDRRHVDKIVGLLQPVFAGGHVSTEVQVTDERGQAITDLDVVCVDVTRRQALVLQLKSFVTPLNLLDIARADDDVLEGIQQCQAAVANVDRTRFAIERRIGAALDPGWTLVHCVIVEAFAGTHVPVDEYPVVTVEWFGNEGIRALGEGGVAAFHERARTLPDGQEFFDSCEQIIEPLDDGAHGLIMGTSYSIWAYTSA